MINTWRIPSSGEKLPVIGCGTYRGFNVRPEGAAFRAASPSACCFVRSWPFGDLQFSHVWQAEAVTGNLLAETNAHKRIPDEAMRARIVAICEARS